jgi:hypothetical protein
MEQHAASLQNGSSQFSRYTAISKGFRVEKIELSLTAIGRAAYTNFGYACDKFGFDESGGPQIQYKSNIEEVITNREFAEL